MIKLLLLPLLFTVSMAQASTTNSYEGVKIVQQLNPNKEVTADSAHLPSKVVAMNPVTLATITYMCEDMADIVVCGEF